MFYHQHHIVDIYLDGPMHFYLGQIFLIVFIFETLATSPKDLKFVVLKSDKRGDLHDMIKWSNDLKNIRNRLRPNAQK